MKIDGGIDAQHLKDIPAAIQALEEMGYDGALSAETAHDPFLPLAQAALHSSRIELATSIAVAFARTPMVLAGISHDLNACAEGRFILGIGSQIKAHITKRFSMPWSSPAARMREYIQALRAIWSNWYEGTPLKFHGEFYQHSLMTPFFTPLNTNFGAPRVFLAAVGPKMTEVAGEVADGIICHAFTTEAYLRKVTLPAIEAGLTKAGRERSDFQISYPSFIATGDDEQGFMKNVELIKRQIAFYGSTPAYRGVLESIDLGDLQPTLNRMSKEGKWKEMGELITDEMMAAFAIVGEPQDIAGKFKARYGDIADRMSVPYTNLGVETRSLLIKQLKAA